MTILELKHISLTYDGIRNILDDISFSVQSGEIIGIVGESGSGKSTLLHVILGLIPDGSVTKGECFLFGRSASERKRRELKKLRGEEVAMIFQDTGRYMNPISRVGAQYKEYLTAHGCRGRKKCIEKEKEMLSRVHLKDTERILHAYPFELSGGMRQRVGIAMAMSLKPKLLLADEPTSALDVTMQAQVVYEMMELRRKYGTSIILVTHNIGVAACMSDKLGIMQNGKLVEWGNTGDIISCPQTEYTRTLLDSVIEIDDERMTVKNE